MPNRQRTGARLAILAVSAALLTAGGARANGVDDGNAGLAALQSRDYDGAIALFTRALGPDGGLRGDDREFAYAARGKAYLAKGNTSDAIVDLDQARQMKPDDADAQNDLKRAISAELPAAVLPGQSAKSIFGQLTHAMGQAIEQDIQQQMQQQQAPQQ